MICAGIDGGSRAIKVVLLDGPRGEVLASGVRDQGVAHDRLARELFEELLEACALARADVARIVATGYTRAAITLADATVTEITCHAVGVRHWIPQAATVIEIGGQDSKLLRLDEDGTVRDFAMNDRCAAGTGRFLEVVAARLGGGLDALGPLAAEATAPAPISSMCVVFAETEIIGLLASGAPPADIVAGVQASVASRVAAMLGRDAVPPVVFTGGVALIPGMADALAAALKTPVTIAPEPQMTGALGAAVLAFRQASGTGKRGRGGR
ncbi:MAG: 2-hydroxyglutaryl-CoA dehydratase [Planctomycetes bacterium]|nr:2-hydroxyglutaryl-CoA dehydratase [Planctomycetota bacterium]